MSTARSSFTKRPWRRRSRRAATLSMMHRLGRGVPRDPERMIALMQQSADAGYHFAQYRLAQTYLSGEGVPDEALEGLGLPNPVAALRYLPRRRGRAMTRRRAIGGALCHRCAGPAPEPRAAIPLDEFLADKGDAPAMALIAFYYEQGIGTERDPELAAAEYVIALETGGVDPATMRGTIGGVVPPWDRKRRSPSRPSCRRGGCIPARLMRRSGPARWGLRGRWRRNTPRRRRDPSRGSPGWASCRTRWRSGWTC
jgi:hypothetical protein